MFIALQVRATLMLTDLHDRFTEIRDGEEGQGMVEYGLILALVAVVAAVTLTPLGAAIAAKFTAIKTALG
ncbi:MAG: Flp/Fap pilin component [Solirubrobacteraceae bacterium]|jgi:pilus assembly protein Flp/PilA|nr:Flp/Fap pilin component [Solirubrobacteraceae bacterium]